MPKTITLSDELVTEIRQALYVAHCMAPYARGAYGKFCDLVAEREEPTCEKLQPERIAVCNTP